MKKKKPSPFFVPLIVILVVLVYIYKTGQYHVPWAVHQVQEPKLKLEPKPQSERVSSSESKSAQTIDEPDTSYFQRADSLLKSGRPEDALKVYIDFIRRYPRHNLSGEALARMGAIYEEKGMISHALKVYEKISREYPEIESMDEIQTKLENLRIKLLFSPAEQEGCIFYEVKYGDSLAKIAKEFGTTVDLLKKTNRLQSDIIFPGQKLKICQLKFNLLVDKSLNILMLKANDTVWKTYRVSTGIDNSTPTGTFKIVNKLVNPVWFKVGAIIPSGSPDNTLGSRWLGLDIKGYGIHGTTEPESIGRQITNGCIRMLNRDVEEIYTIIPIGTEVTIID